MPHIHVTCAIIERNGHVLAVQRSANMKLPLKWEFPGGKIESDEEAKACLQRQILITPIDCIDLFRLKYVSEIYQKKPGLRFLQTNNEYQAASCGLKFQISESITLP